MTTLLALAFFLLPLSASAQTTCFSYDNGQTISCDGPNLSNRTITQFDRNRGIITDERGNVEPYTIMPNRTDESRRDEERRRALIYGEDRNDSYSSRSRSDEYGVDYGY